LSARAVLNGEHRRYKTEKPAPDMTLYPLSQAIHKAKSESPERKFEESIDFAMFLNIDPRKADHQIRTITVLPHGTGKDVKVCVFATDEAQHEQAKEAGAFVVGGAELINEVKNGRLDFDRTVATPKAMPLLSKVARILGPRGLMPNNKLGTVTDDVAGKVKELLGGITLRADKAGNVHALIGTRSFDPGHVQANAMAVVDKVLELRPVGVKEPYIKSCSVSTSMGPSFKVLPSDLVALSSGGGAARAVQKRAATEGAIRFVDPKDWKDVDLDRIRSRKLRRYLAARRVAEGLAEATPEPPLTYAARSKRRHVDNKRTRALKHAAEAA